MITLGILRHAKSSWDNSAARDFDRPLNARGREAAERMGRELKQRGVVFDHLLASPAARVCETLDRLGKSYGELPAVQSIDEIYAAIERTLLALVQALPDTVRAPLLVGHNPGLHALILALTSNDGRGLRNRVAANFPTAAFAAIDFPVEQWKEITPGAGRLRALILPRELD